MLHGGLQCLILISLGKFNPLHTNFVVGMYAIFRFLTNHDTKMQNYGLKSFNKTFNSPYVKYKAS